MTPHEGSARSCIVPFIDQSEVLCTLLDDQRILAIAKTSLGDDFNYMGSDGNFYVGDTGWHSDGGHGHGDPMHIKIAFYLDALTGDTGSLRVIPGSHRLGDHYADALSGQIRNSQDLWGVHGRDVPATIFNTQPGDVVLFNHNCKHSAFGGGVRRRMFTMNLCQRYPEDRLQDLRNYIGGAARFWIERSYGEKMLKTAGPGRMQHLEQVMANDGHLAEMSRQARGQNGRTRTWLTIPVPYAYVFPVIHVMTPRDNSNDNIEADYTRIVADNEPTRFLYESPIEIVCPVEFTNPPEYALFDFDGTLSLVREGWMDVMIPMMVTVLLETGTQESRDQLHSLVYKFVSELTGKQTIYQMIRLNEEVVLRGGNPMDPLEYKHEYHNLLMERIMSRREGLRTGRNAPTDMLVPGSFELLNALKQRGVQMYLASGTDDHYVREEAALLEIDLYFGDRIYGAIDDYRSFSKAQVVRSILNNGRVVPAKLVGFGDGYVEILNVKEAGGTAVGVASDEAGRSGKPDIWKRKRLIGVGADLIVPDFRHYEDLVEYLWPSR